MGDIGSQQTRDIGPKLAEYWPSVCDAGPTFNQLWVNVPCLLVVALADASTSEWVIGRDRNPARTSTTPDRTVLHGIHYPANTKHLYNIYTMLGQRRRRSGRRCINVIQMFCVCWVPIQHHPDIMLYMRLFSKEHLTSYLFFEVYIQAGTVYCKSSFS